MIFQGFTGTLPGILKCTAEFCMGNVWNIDMPKFHALNPVCLIELVQIAQWSSGSINYRLSGGSP